MKKKNTIGKMLAMHTMSRTTVASVWLHIRRISEQRQRYLWKKLKITPEESATVTCRKLQTVPKSFILFDTITRMGRGIQSQESVRNVTIDTFIIQLPAVSVSNTEALKRIRTASISSSL